VVEEIGRSNQAEALLEAGDIQNFGRLMNECHANLYDLYDVSCPELNVMVNIAQTLGGCYGAADRRGLWPLYREPGANERVERFAKALANGYESETGLRS
jgi:galactokinase